jgi:tetratricopeptide (TPR) repeat protein
MTLPGRLNKRLLVFALVLGVFYAAADYRLAGFWRTQADLYGRIIELSPRLSRAYYFLGKDYLEKERYDKALELFQKASSMGQTPPDNYYSWLGNAYAFSEDYERAVSAYREQLKTKPDEKAAMQNLSSALIMLKRYDEAMAVVDRLLLLYPGDASALSTRRSLKRPKGGGERKTGIKRIR